MRKTKLFNRERNDTQNDDQTDISELRSTRARSERSSDGSHSRRTQRKGTMEELRTGLQKVPGLTTREEDREGTHGRKAPDSWIVKHLVPRRPDHLRKQ